VTGFIWLGIHSNGGCCEHGNEPSVSIKGGECLGVSYPTPYFLQQIILKINTEIYVMFAKGDAVCLFRSISRHFITFGVAGIIS
jgi:hypothetical protein